MTKIEWADKTWSPVTGCSPVSEGCEHCWAERFSKRLAGRCGYPADDPFRVTLHPDRLEQPLKRKRPSRMFVCSMGDLFHEDVDEKYIAKVLAICDLARQHTYLILTKRPERMAALFNDEDFVFHVGWFQSQAGREFGLPRLSLDEIGPWPLKNVWLGVTVENQARADERIPILLQIPAAVRFVSVEPMLGPVDLTYWLNGAPEQNGYGEWIQTYPPLDWVICGGETGPGARPINYYWAESLREQCVEAGVPFFFKQWGEWIDPTQMDNGIEFPDWEKSHLWHGETGTVRVGKKAAGRLLDGREWNEYPG